MAIKDAILDGLKPALVMQIGNDISSGRIKQPIDFEVISESVWKRLRVTPMTSGAILTFRINKEDIDALLRSVFKELKVEVINEGN